MQTSVKLATTLVACGLGAASAHSAVIFTETFPNPTDDHAPLSSVGWESYFSTDGTAHPAGANTSAGPTIIASDFLYHANATRNVPNLWFTQKQTFGDIANLETISTDVRNSTPEEAIHFVIRVGSTWYASFETFNATGGNFASRSVDVQEDDWGILPVVLGSSLPGEGYFDGGSFTVSPLPASGTITAVGYFTDKLISTVRLDNLTLEGVIPEPTSLGLAALAGLGLTRRRR
ncbi:MAG: PEP-CTERM sorting domain-containing protein [Phycisphaerae bacterium]